METILCKNCGKEAPLVRYKKKKSYCIKYLCSPCEKEKNKLYARDLRNKKDPHRKVKNLPNETWIPIKGYEGLYEISSKLRIKNLIGPKNRHETVLKQQIGIRGYFVVTLWKKAKCASRVVHRLYAEHFIPNPENKQEVNHKNGIKTDNSPKNLEWMTHKENMDHAIQTGLWNYKPTSFKKGDKPHNARLTQKIFDKMVEMKRAGKHTNTICKETGYSATRVNAILRGINIKTTGIIFYKWNGKD